MDWYSWLSKTNLELSIIYEYGLIFTQNELQEDDIIYFNHEFLQSMSISVAKHRLEILKLARKEAERRSINGFSKLFSAINKTRKLLAKNISKWSVQKQYSPTTPFPIDEVTPRRGQPSGALKRVDGPKEDNYDKAMVTSRCAVRSGPLDRRVHENLMVNSRSLSISGPLDRKLLEKGSRCSDWSPGSSDGLMRTEKFPFASRCRTVSGSLGLSPNVYDEVQSVWSLMFQDMKPT